MKGGGDTTTTTNSGDLPAYIKPYVTEALKMGQSAAKLPYQAYNNPRLANFSPETNAAFSMIGDQAAAGTPGIDAAVTSAGGVAGYQAKGIPGTDLQPYMNPYVQNVLDVQKNRATQTFQEQQAGRDAAAVQAGAFGGDRRFVQDSLAQRDLNQQMQEMDATGLAAAFDRATGLFQGDEENRRLGAALGLQGAQTQGALSQTQQDMKLGLAEALSGVGAKRQQREQAGLDLAYQDFVNQRDYPKQQAQFYQSLISGTPVTPSSTSSTTTPAPDFLSQLLGLAVGGAGIYDLLQ
jgi:hypothetical protein